MERRQCRCHCHSFIRRNSLWVFSLSRSIDWLPHIIVNFMLKRKTICFLFSLSPSFARRWKWRICRIEDWVEERNGFSITNIKCCVSIYPFFQIAFQFFFVFTLLECLCSLTGGKKTILIGHRIILTNEINISSMTFIIIVFTTAQSGEQQQSTARCGDWYENKPCR